MDSAKAPGGGQDFRIVALKHLGLRFVSPKSATMSTEAMLTWKDLAPGPRPVGRGLADQQVLVSTQRREELMDGKIAGGNGLIGAALPVTGINILYSLLIAFTLIGAGFAEVRCIPKRHTS